MVSEIVSVTPYRSLTDSVDQVGDPRLTLCITMQLLVKDRKVEPRDAGRMSRGR